MMSMSSYQGPLLQLLSLMVRDVFLLMMWVKLLLMKVEFLNLRNFEANDTY